MQHGTGTPRDAEALRRRLDAASAEEAARARQRQAASWRQAWKEIPLNRATAIATSSDEPLLHWGRGAPLVHSTGARPFDEPAVVGPNWSKVGLCGFRRDKLLWTAHLACCLLHLTFMVVTLSVSATGDTTLTTWRQRFLFTRNESTCGVLANFTDTPEGDVPVAVLVQSGSIHTGAATAGFFALSAIAHGLWVATTSSRWLYSALYGWLDNALAPLRWAEYACSASLMFCILSAISGGRNEAELSQGYVLIATTMFFGYLTELLSRPAAGSNGERWTGQREDNRFSNFVHRMQPHILGMVPYFAAWANLIALYIRTLGDVDELYGDRVGDVVPAFILTAVWSTFLTFSSFTAVQQAYQWFAPRHYWQTELWYCLLSATSKSVLGGILLGNVLLLSSAEEGTVGSSD
jgi:hypothetical protein